MTGDATLRFVAIPLTPIHVGDGDVIAADRYRIREPEKLEDWQLDEMDEDDPRITASASGVAKLELFEPAAVVSKLTPAQRRNFAAALDAGRLHEALGILRQATSAEDVSDRVALSAASLNDLKKAQTDTGRGGDVHGFIRSAGRPYLPGSSLKGALRTASVSAFAAEPAVARMLDEEAGPALNQPNRFHQLSHDRLEAIALDRPPGRTERDPLRCLRVADAPLPPDATLIDKVVNCRRERDGIAHNDMQMHFERLRSLADDEAAHPFDVVIAVDHVARQRQRRNLDREKAPSRELDLAIILARMKKASEQLWQGELDRFWRRHPLTERALTAVWRAHYRPDDPGCILARVGRFAHFEAKSVDRYRRGVQEIRRPGQRSERKAMVAGGTRGAVLDGSRYLPLGWLLLRRSD